MPAEQTRVDWQQLLETALTTEGSVGNVYNRFHEYSVANTFLFMMQGIREPVASESRWKALGRTRRDGTRRKEVIVPVFAKATEPPPVETTDETEETPEAKKERVARLIGFTVVNGVLALSDTDGPEIPPIQVPQWDLETALAKLAIKRVPFEQIDGNIQGVSHGREYALNPVAVHPLKTTFHEMGHIILGHTVATSFGEYSQHRGKMEFGAEAVAYLAMNELQQMDEETASHSRGYLQHWLGTEQPTDREIRLVFAATDQILKAGRLPVAEATEQ
jgi:hypothetical protein